jgi:hypothetical protein
MGAGSRDGQRQLSAGTQTSMRRRAIQNIHDKRLIPASMEEAWNRLDTSLLLAKPGIIAVHGPAGRADPDNATRRLHHDTPAPEIPTCHGLPGEWSEVQAGTGGDGTDVRHGHNFQEFFERFWG